MCQNTFLTAGNRLFVYSFTTGAKAVKLPPMNERDVLALALWLARRGLEDEADRLLDAYTSRKPG